MGPNSLCHWTYPMGTWSPMIPKQSYQIWPFPAPVWLTGESTLKRILNAHLKWKLHLLYHLHFTKWNYSLLVRPFSVSRKKMRKFKFRKIIKQENQLAGQAVSILTSPCLHLYQTFLLLIALNGIFIVQRRLFFAVSSGPFYARFKLGNILTSINSSLV